MLAKKFRLPATIRLSHSESIVIQEFVFKYSLNSFTVPRVGVVISKRVDKRATKRNELRRVLHQLIQDELPRLKSYDMLFIMNAKAAICSKEKLREAFLSALTMSAIL